MSTTTKKEKKTRGRPRLELDEDVIEKLARILCTMEEIAEVMECSVDTLERNYADVIKRGRSQGLMSIRRKQYLRAMQGNVGMLVWLGKQYLGQRDRHDFTTLNKPMIVKMNLGSLNGKPVNRVFEHGSPGAAD